MRKDFSFNRRDTSRFGNPRDSRGGNSFGRNSGGNRSFDRPMMYDAVCAKCGKNCQVPFKPTGNRDVFCSDCFERDNDRDDRGSNRSFNSNRDSGRNSNRDSRFSEKEMFSAICDKCGKECEVPFKPTSGKPVYCSDCFTKSDGREGNDRNNRYERNDRNDRTDYNYKSDSKSGGSSNGSNDDIKKQFETLNKKIDEIQKLLNSLKLVEKNSEKAPEQKGPSALEKFLEKERIEAQPVVEKITVEAPIKEAKAKTKVKAAKKEVKAETTKTVKKAVKKPAKKVAKKA